MAVSVNGTTHDRFHAVRTLANSIANTYVGGFGLHVLYKGEPVVNLWAGERDRDGNAWAENTACASFSTTKGAMSTLLHQELAARNIPWETPVCEVWPAANSMTGVSILDVLTHRAGYWNVQRLASSVEQLCDWNAMLAQICALPPQAPYGGNKSAYHALTYGHVAGGLYEAISGQSVEQGFQRLSQHCGEIAIGCSSVTSDAQLRNLRKRREGANNSVPPTRSSAGKKPPMLVRFFAQ